jgi:hypothetical protein
LFRNNKICAGTTKFVQEQQKYKFYWNTYVRFWDTLQRASSRRVKLKFGSWTKDTFWYQVWEIKATEFDEGIRGLNRPKGAVIFLCSEAAKS